MTYKIIRDNGNGRSKQTLFSSDDLEEIAEFAQQKGGSLSGQDRRLKADGGEEK